MLTTSGGTVILKINGVIDTQCLLYLKENVKKILPTPPETLILYIRSIGGDLGITSQCIKELNKLSKKNVSVVAISYDYVNSAAIALYASASLRLSRNKYDVFYFHNAKDDKGVGEEYLKKTETDVFNFLSKRFHQSFDFIATLAKKNSVIKAEEAVKIGITHSIMKTTSG